MNLRTMFALRRTSDVLGKVRDAATALAFAGGRITPLSALGVLTHVAAFVVGVCGRDFASVAARWPRLSIASELHRLVYAALDTAAVHRASEWTHCDIGGHAVLMNMSAEHMSGAFHVEGDAVDVLAWVREQSWKRIGANALLAPVGRWGDSVDLRPSNEPAGIDSSRAREIWARVAPVLAAGHPRAVLLDGPPRTGKSTVARELVRRTAEMLQRDARVLRIAVSDFTYLAPSVVAGAVELLRPDILVLDDIDRFAGTAQLLDLFEGVRQNIRLLVATSNNPKALPVALRLPGRIDEVVHVGGAGAELATAIMEGLWPRLTVEQQDTIAAWPVALIHDLRLRLELLHGAQADAEIAELQRRADETADRGAT